MLLRHSDQCKQWQTVIQVTTALLLFRSCHAPPCTGQAVLVCNAQQTSSLEPDRGINTCDAVLLGTGTEVRLADAGLARFMHHDYMAAESSVGAFTWTVRPPPGASGSQSGDALLAPHLHSTAPAARGSVLSKDGCRSELLDCDMYAAVATAGSKLHPAEHCHSVIHRRRRWSTACRQRPPPTSGPWASCCTSC